MMLPGMGGVLARPRDPLFDKVELLLHFDGPDGSTTFKDHSSRNRTVTVNGNVQIDTAQSVFGGASGLFDGSGDFISLADDSAWDLGVGGEPFCVEFYMRRNGDMFGGGYSRGGGASNWSLTNGHMMTVGLLDNVTTYFQVNVGGTPVGVTTSLPADLTWVPIAGTYDGATTRLYVGGNSVGTPQSVAGISAPTTRNLTYIGRIVSATSHDLNGHLDEYRITKGAARYTGSSYTPATAPFPPP